MKHLTIEALVDLAEEGAAAAARNPHAASCAECRETIAALGDLRAVAREAEVEEPWPLFWEHFPRRVTRAIGETQRTRGLLSRPARWGWRCGLAGVAAACIVAYLLWPWAPHGAPLPAGPSRSRVAATLPAPPVVAAPDADAAVPSGGTTRSETAGDDALWGFVMGMTGGMDWEMVQEVGFSVRPGTADVVAADLSADEQEELARLLQEAARGGAH